MKGLFEINIEGSVKSETKKTFLQKLGTIVNNRNIKQFRNKNNLLGKHYSYHIN